MIESVRAVLAEHAPTPAPLDGRREAAVMLLLQPDAGDHGVFFQVRTQHVRHHRGEISLPGGARDPGDGTLLDTALRETEEEIGVPAEHIEVLGRLDDEVTRASDYRITPFVGLLDGARATPFARARGEVHELLVVPLSHLRSHDARAWKVVDRDGTPMPTPAYRFGEHLIWGATARVLGGFLGLLDAAPGGSGS